MVVKGEKVNKWGIIALVAVTMSITGLATFFITRTESHQATRGLSATTAPSISVLSIADVNVVAAKIAAAIKKDEEASVDGLVSEATVPVISTDLKRTDSLVNPVVGEVVFRSTRITHGTGNSAFRHTLVELLTITLARNAEWKAIRAVKRPEIEIDMQQGMSQGGQEQAAPRSMPVG